LCDERAKSEAAGKKYRKQRGIECAQSGVMSPMRKTLQGLLRKLRASRTIHVLVNNAGGPPAGGFDLFDDSAWQHAFELDF
jgi:NAD(P)-dependent dehydrogenase (short-subunit alcohol dehydrogenase family)